MPSAVWSKPKTVVVTGGTGFVGTYVCRLLGQQGQTAIAVGIEPFSEEMQFVLADAGAAVRFVRGDICDAAGLDAICAQYAPDAIVHAAGLVGHDTSLADPLKTYAVNVGGTVKVFEAARRAKVGKVLLISSNAAYHRKERDVFDEAHPTTSLFAGNPNAHYGASKMAAEQVALAYHTFHGIDALAIRITSVYGFGMKPGQMQLKQIVEGAANGETVRIASGGHVVRDYTYVEDSAAGIVAILNCDTRAVAQRIFNISRGELTSTFDIAEAASAAFPHASIEVGDAMTEFEKATLKQRAPLSWAAAEKAFGYRPRYSLRQGIGRYAEFYRTFKKARASVPAST
ncbi:MAG TPA: NAD(P)-dependent oxidoreductase [Xanthobacteraceae bacterium]|nr:NAD(P)-dependent oxidoreductase [Xanthobacteraceae bacterium]